MKNLAKLTTLALATALVSVPALAQETAAAGITNSGLAFLGLGLAAIGGALAQSRVASAALEGIARNPQASDKIFTPLILSLAFIESLVIYALVIAIIKT